MKKKDDISDRIRLIRNTLQMRQKDFADKVGISISSLSEMEKGKYKPNLDFITKLSSEFNVNLYYLIFGRGDMFTDPTREFYGGYRSCEKVSPLF
jgi:transcriptional regulator with XRE-family HTH domain